MYRPGTRQQAVWEFIRAMDVGEIKEFDVIEPGRDWVIHHSSARAAIGMAAKRSGMRFRTFSAPSKKDGCLDGIWALWVVRVL